MPQAKKYLFDLFISYSHEDKKWADRLYDDLKKLDPALEIFLDDISLHLGDNWKTKLLDSLQQSRNLLVLISKAAEASGWVAEEQGYFEGSVDSTTANGACKNRRLLVVMLDGENKPFGDIQSFMEIQTGNLYPGGVDNVPKATWERLIREISRALGDDDDDTSIPVILSVMAMTRAEAQRLWDDDDEGFQAALGEIGIKSGADLLSCYGDTPGEWRPYSSPESVETILDRVKNEINMRVKGKPFRWRAIGEDFYSSKPQTIRQELNRIGPDTSAVFVVDPVSLYQKRIANQLVTLRDFFNNGRFIILVLSPVSIPNPYRELMSMVETVANQFFNYFYDGFLESGYANCGVNVCDERDIRRLVRVSLGPYFSPEPAKQTSDLLTMVSRKS